MVHLTEHSYLTTNADDEEILKNMPWLDSIKEFCKKFDFECRHQPYCTNLCIERLYRQCYRLAKAVNVIYESDLIVTTAVSKNNLNRRNQLIDGWRSEMDDRVKVLRA